MPVPTSPALRIQDITFRRGRPILQGVTWTVERGQHWCILGPNGCGKTSLINVITGYEMATSGSIEIGDSRFGNADWREVRKRVGLVTNTLTTYLEPGEPVLDAVVSGREAMINLVGAPNPVWVKEARHLLEEVGCGYLVGGVWGPLSQGEKQKILICRALMARYDVLILDEPCAGLDPVARERFLRWVQDLSVRPNAPSMILVTHHVEEILPCISHVLLMRDGKAHAAGPRDEVLNDAALSHIYGAPVRLGTESGRYFLRLIQP